MAHIWNQFVEDFMSEPSLWIRPINDILHVFYVYDHYNKREAFILLKRLKEKK